MNDTSIILLVVVRAHFLPVTCQTLAARWDATYHCSHTCDFLIRYYLLHLSIWHAWCSPWLLRKYKANQFLCSHLNPPPHGGGGRIRPPPHLGFSWITSQSLRFWIPNLTDLSAHEFDVLQSKNEPNRPKIFWVIANFVTSLQAIFGQKVATLCAAVKGAVFDWATQKRHLRGKTTSSTTWLSRFFEILSFWPRKFKKSIFWR